jgi:hypothetical protein
VALPGPGKLSVDPVTGSLLDGSGRTRVFHGVNFVCKAPPWCWS